MLYQIGVEYNDEVDSDRIQVGTGSQFNFDRTAHL